MNYETKARSLLKALSWRTLATLTTAVLVYLFTGELGLAITVGSFEVLAKMGLYFVHERLWQKVRFGKKVIPSFVLWFTGLPSSGKREIANQIFDRIKEKELRVERIDSRGVRPLFPETGFSPNEVDQHVRRAGHLCAMLEKSGVIVVASFVSPYVTSRKFARKLATNFIEVHLRSTPEACAKRDSKGRYERARRGEYSYFPGVDVKYEESKDPEITINVDERSVEEAVAEVESYLITHYITAK